MKNQIQLLDDACRMRGLEINEEKSMIMVVSNPKEKINEQKGMWKVGEIQDRTICEGSQYKYLGITLSRSSGFTLFRHIKEKSLNSMVASLKTRATSSLDRHNMAVALWKVAIKPIALQGAAVIQFTKSYLNNLEKFQSKVSKWIVGAGRSGSASTLRMDFGWTSMEGEASKSKLN